MINDPLIDIQHVSFAYAGYKSVRDNDRGHAVAALALRDVKMQVQPGEFVSLLGHNGSGKSTLARHCNALLLPTEGKVFVGGFDTNDAGHRRAIREMVGMIFQNPDNQIIATVVEDDVAWALAMRGMDALTIRKRVTWAMEAVGIEHLRGLPPNKLSGGQRQRLAIAGVLALRPQCIIADEATSQLDPLSRREIVGLLHHLNRAYGLTILHVTHLLEEAAQAQRIVVMEAGRIVMDGPPVKIFADLGRLSDLKLTIPEPNVLAARLRENGHAIPPQALTVETIADAIAEELGKWP